METQGFCKECGDQFPVERISQVFCDRKCRHKWHNRQKKELYAEAKLARERK